MLPECVSSGAVAVHTGRLAAAAGRLMKPSSAATRVSRTLLALLVLSSSSCYWYQYRYDYVSLILITHGLFSCFITMVLVPTVIAIIAIFIIVVITPLLVLLFMRTRILFLLS